MLTGVNETTARFILDLVLGRRQPAVDLDWNAALEASLRYRLGGVAWALGPWPHTVPAAVTEAWEEAHHRQALVATLLLEQLDRVRDALAASGVACVPVKGMGLIEAGVYGLGERAVDDLDVWVAEEDGPRAVEALRWGGWEPWSRDPAGTLSWSDAATFAPRGAAGAMGLSVDLHWRLHYGALRFGGGAARSGSGPPPSLEPERHLVLTLEHFFKHLRYRTHVAALADAVRLARLVSDWDGVVRGMAGSRWEPALAALLAGLLRSQHLPVPEVVEPAVPLRLRRLDPARLILRGEGPAPRARGVLERWWWSGLGHLLQDVGEALFPPASWLRARYGRAGARRLALLPAHLSRVLRWAVGSGPSPLAPNQE